MNAQGIDLAKFSTYARAMLSFEGALAAGVDAFGNKAVVQSINENSNGPSRFKMEPRFYNGVSSDNTLSLDGLTRMVLFPHLWKSGGTINAVNISYTVQWSRDDGANYVDAPTTLIPQLMMSDTDLRTRVHVVENVFPADFMQADGVDVDDYLTARVKLNSVGASSVADIFISVMMLLVPGATPSVQKKPRGALYSTPNVDY